TVCINLPAFALEGATPVGGDYSGIGVSGNEFFPAVAEVGTHVITYNFTDNNGCSNSCTFLITVVEAPMVTCPPNDTVCLNGSMYDLGALDPAPDPAGGEFSGPGVSMGFLFEPDTAGVYTIAYAYEDDNGCKDTCVFYITVHPLPVVSCPDSLKVCFDDPAIALDTLMGLSPASTGPNSVFFGSGVSPVDSLAGMWIFDPAVAGVGAHEIVYRYVDALTGCSDTCKFVITVCAPPMLSCPANVTVNACPDDNDLIADFEDWLDMFMGETGAFFTTTPEPPSACGGTTTVTFTSSNDDCGDRSCTR
ncbi:MAG: HYR domain-containing protein, partial [Saprospiraceae bacterium]